MLDPQRCQAEHGTQAMRLFLEENWPARVVLDDDNHRAASATPNASAHLLPEAAARNERTKQCRGHFIKVYHLFLLFVFIR